MALVRVGDKVIDRDKINRVLIGCWSFGRTGFPGEAAAQVASQILRLTLRT